MHGPPIVLLSFYVPLDTLCLLTYVRELVAPLSHQVRGNGARGKAKSDMSMTQMRITLIFPLTLILGIGPPFLLSSLTWPHETPHTWTMSLGNRIVYVMRQLP